MALEVTTSDVLAGLALLLSVYATWKTVQTNKSQERLNRKLLEKEEAETAEGKKASLGARFVKQGSNSYRLLVFNKGVASARNVRIEFPDGSDYIPRAELNQKFPMQVMERHQSVELVASVSMDTNGKHALRFTWDDDFKRDNEKVIYVTI